MRFLTTHLAILLLLAVVFWEGTNAQRRYGRRWRNDDIENNISGNFVDDELELTDEELRFLALLNKFQGLKGQSTTTTAAPSTPSTITPTGTNSPTTTTDTGTQSPPTVTDPTPTTPQGPPTPTPPASPTPSPSPTTNSPPAGRKSSGDYDEDDDDDDDEEHSENNHKRRDEDDYDDYEDEDEDEEKEENSGNKGDDGDEDGDDDDDNDEDEDSDYYDDNSLTHRRRSHFADEQPNIYRRRREVLRLRRLLGLTQSSSSRGRSHGRHSTKYQRRLGRSMTTPLKQPAIKAGIESLSDPKIEQKQAQKTPKVKKSSLKEINLRKRKKSRIEPAN